MIAEAKRQLDFASRSFQVHNGRSKNGKVKVLLELPRYVCTFIEILAQNASLKKFQTFSNTSNSVLHLSIPLSLPSGSSISKESWVEIPQPGRFIVPFIPPRPRRACVSSMSFQTYIRMILYKRLTEGEHISPYRSHWISFEFEISRANLSSRYCSPPLLRFWKFCVWNRV